MSITELREQLKENIMVVDFIKVNGDKRVMTCTLREDLLPTKPLTEDTNGTQRKESTDTVSVWDVNAKGWRSFRYANVVETSIKDN